MKTPKNLVLALAVFAVAVVTAAQGLDPASILKPPPDSWPTYSGDYTSRRYSSLTQIDQANVKNLTVEWVSHLTGGMGTGGGGFPFGPAAPRTIVGGEVAEPIVTGGMLGGGGGVNVRGGILQVNGILYVSSEDNAWAIDARDGTVLWHYFWKTKGGTHTSNKGLGMYGNWLFMETADDYLISLDATTGKERWHKEIAPFSEQYFSEAAPVIIGNHVLVGTGDDLDEPGFLQSFDPETGELQWKSYTVPMNPGDPGLETWPSLDAAKHGGGQVWTVGAYDPETHLYMFGTGNATPAYTTQVRKGDNLFTCTLVAVNVDTGKMAWYYQTSPHDAHDWDSTQTPVLVDGEFNGKPRKLVLQATRNGYFFVLDRVTGEHLLTSKFAESANWSKELNAKGAPVGDPEKFATVPGSLVNGSETNWPPPAYSPQTGLFYLPVSESLGMMYLTETDPRGAMGLGGTGGGGGMSLGSSIEAIDYKTGKIVWKHDVEGEGAGPGGNGLLTTAGRLLFGTGGGGTFVAFDASTGKPLWHSRISVSNAPETYMLDDHQYVIVAAGDSVYAFTLQ